MSARDTRYRRRGQTLVEYALVLPFLFLLILSMIEAGRLFLAWHQASGAARAAARKACLYYDTTPQSVVEAAQKHAQLGIVGSGSYSIEVQVGNGSTNTYESATGQWSGNPPLPVNTPGVPVRVTVRIDFAEIFPMRILPEQVSDYEIRYTEGQPARGY